MSNEKLDQLLNCVKLFQILGGGITIPQLRAFIEVEMAGGEIPLSQLPEVLDVTPEQCRSTVDELSNGKVWEGPPRLFKVAQLKKDPEEIVRLSRRGRAVADSLRFNLGDFSRWPSD